MTLAPLRLAAAVVLAAAALIAVPAQAAAPVGLIGCSHKLETSPTVYALACGDANIALTTLRWTSFGATTARASGVLSINTCDPTCVAGKVIHTRVTVVVSRARTVHGMRTYTRIAMTKASGKSAGRYGVNRYGPYQLPG